jgi:hypothetical protein
MLTDILVFRTGIRSDDDLARAAEFLNECKEVLSWSIDREDTDKVLRVETSDLPPAEIIRQISSHGILCVELED